MQSSRPATDLELDRTVDSNADTVVDAGRVAEGQAALAAGEALGRYVVLELLGRGGMGEVYAAYDPELDRKVAVKVIHAAVRESGDPEVAKARLLREAQTMAKLSHPNVVAVYDVGAIDDQVYVAMEYVNGSDLREWVAAAERGAGEILEVFIAAAKGLAAAHDAGLVHRDFKPENVLIGDDDGRVRVIDFGIARGQTTDDRPTMPRSLSDRLIDELSVDRKLSTSLETRGGLLVGTPAYMAPEQFLGGGADARTDQFAFCVALWEALAGERPFPGHNVADLSAAVLDNERREMPADAGVSVRTSRALARGLAIEREDRFEHMAALIDALRPPVPRASRQLLVGGGAIAAAGIAAAVIVALSGSSAGDPCDEVGDDAAEIWSAARRGAVEAALQASGGSNAGEAWARVSSHLDKYVADWSSARRDVCEASRVRREQSAELAEKRIACLDERLAELRAVVGLLESADRAMVKTAVETTIGLSRIEDCANLSRLAGAIEIPDELVAEIAALRAFERAAQLERGLEAAGQVIERAAAQRSRAAEARALLWRGRLESRAGRSPQEVESFFASVRIADDIGDTHTEAAAWTEIVRSVGSRLHRYSEAARWAEHARLAIRQDGSDPALEAELHNHLGWVKRTEGRLSEALAEFRQSIKLSQQAFGERSEEVLSGMAGAAATLRDLERLDEAIEVQREILEGRRALYGDNHAVMTWAHASLAFSLSAVKEYDEARTHFEKGLALMREHLGERHPNVATVLSNKALLSERLGDFEAAAALYQEALEMWSDNYGPRHPQVYDAFTDLARIARKLDDMPLALRRQREAVRGLRALGADARPRLGVALAELCDLERRARDLAGARRSCAEALGLLETDATDTRDLATALTFAAEVDLASNQRDSAAELARRALEIRREQRSSPTDHAETLAVSARALEATGAGRAEVMRLVGELEALAGKLHPGDDSYAEIIAALKSAT